MKPLDEGTYPVPLNIRARHKRALRWPLILWRYRQTGLSWRAAWRATHIAIWFKMRAE